MLEALLLSVNGIHFYFGPADYTASLRMGYSGPFFTGNIWMAYVQITAQYHPVGELQVYLLLLICFKRSHLLWVRRVISWLAHMFFYLSRSYSTLHSDKKPNLIYFQLSYDNISYRLVKISSKHTCTSREYGSDAFWMISLWEPLEVNILNPSWQDTARRIEVKTSSSRTVESKFTRRKIDMTLLDVSRWRQAPPGQSNPNPPEGKLIWHC